MSYDEYLEKLNKEDTKESYIDYRTDICGVRYTKALNEANSPDFGLEM